MNEFIRKLVYKRSVKTMATAEELAEATVSPLTRLCLTDVTFTGQPVQNTVFTTTLQGFPTLGTSYAVLSSGDASLTPGVATTFVSNNVNGPTLPAGDPLGSPDGLTSLDVATFSLTFRLPKDPGVLTFDWKFGTEENPTFVGQFADYFRADLLTPSGNTNIALLPDGNPVTVTNAAPFSNSPTGTSQNPGPPFPTPNDVTYNAVTSPILSAYADLSCLDCDVVTLQIRVADVIDRLFNTAVFIDNIRISGCEKRMSETVTKPFGEKCCQTKETIATDRFCDVFSVSCTERVTLWQAIETINGTIGIFYDDGCAADLDVFIIDSEGVEQSFTVTPGSSYAITVSDLQRVDVECDGVGNETCEGVYCLNTHDRL